MHNTSVALSHLNHARRFARLLDSQFGIAGFRFGIDAIVGFLPGAGDLITLVMGCYLLWIGALFNLPASALLRMIINLAADFAIGTIPLVGDVTDIFFKSNMRNLAILEKYLPDNVIEGEVITE